LHCLFPLSFFDLSSFTPLPDNKKGRPCPLLGRYGLCFAGCPAVLWLKFFWDSEDPGNRQDIIVCGFPQTIFNPSADFAY
jgi:hypothetical protein